MSNTLKTVSLAALTILLCGLMLTTAYAQKAQSPKKIAKTPEQIEKYRRNHPEAVTPIPPKATPVAWQAPYTRPGENSPARPSPAGNSNSGVRPTPGGTPNYSGLGHGAPTNGGQSYRRDDDNYNGPGGRPTTGGAPNHGSLPYRRDDDNRDNDSRDNDNRYGYVGRPSESGRAYELPERRDWDRDRDRDNTSYRPLPSGRPYQEPVRVYVPQRPLYLPAPAPRCGGAPGYYPQSNGPFSAPGCGDLSQIPLLGCEIIAADGTFLGVIDRDYNSPESIANRASAFGSPYSRVSIWNPDGPYGSVNGPYSPWNRNSYRPPVLYWHGVFRCYLSSNPDLQPKIFPDRLIEHIQVNPWR